MSPEWATVAIAGVAVLVALAASLVSYAVYRSQADPEVIVYLEPDERRQTVINLVIKNVGNAAARDVSFKSSRPVPSEAFGLEAATAEVAGPMTRGPLVAGIPFLPPGATRIITWGQFGGLVKALGEDTITVTATYHASHIGAPRPIRMTTACPLEIKSFEGTDASDKNYDKRIADNLEKVAGAIDEVAKAVAASG